MLMSRPMRTAYLTFVMLTESRCISFQLSSTIARFLAKSWRLISFVNGVYLQRSKAMWRY